MRQKRAASANRVVESASLRTNIAICVHNAMQEGSVSGEICRCEQGGGIGITTPKIVVRALDVFTLTHTHLLQRASSDCQCS